MNWKLILSIASKHLSNNPCEVVGKRTWCAWTTFERLGEDAGYWTAPLPDEAELLEGYIADGGNWGQPFPYEQIAHLIVPRRYYWDRFGEGVYVSGHHIQDIDGVSELLTKNGIPHRLTIYALEVKLY